MRFTLERLEQRRLLATIAWERGVVTVLGNAGGEAIVAEIDAEHLVFSGSETRIPIGEVMRLDVQLLDGNDSFTNDTPFPATIDGGAGDDTLLGGDGADLLLGGAGADRLEGRLGDDRLDGGGESQDQMFGGDGIDVIAGVTVTYGADKVLTVRGTAATEEIRLLNVGNYLRIDGAEHTPRLATSVNRVDVYLGDGDDHFANVATRTVQVWGEGGDDVLNSFNKDLVDGGAGHNVLLGSDQLSRIEWTGNDLVLTGTEASDRLILRRANDEVFLSGMTTVWTVPSSVTIRGLAGDDHLINLTDLDVTLFGGDGHDVIISSRAAKMYGENGDDYLSGSRFNDTLVGGSGNDRLYGDNGNDSYVFATGVGFERDIVGEYGRTYANNADTLDFLAVVNDITVKFRGDLGTSLDSNRELLFYASAAENIYGGSGNDLLNSHAATLHVMGNAGNDRIVGNSGSETLSGGSGDDEIFGGSGNDLLNGGTGNDQLHGEGGHDVYEFATGVGFERDVVQENNSTDADALDFSAVADDVTLTFDGDVGISRDLHRELSIYGKAAENIYGGFGSDLLNSHNATRYIAGNGGNDRIFGKSLSETLSGGSGDDEIFGRGGEDRLDGGAGNDRLYGESGNDVYLFATGVGFERDVIQDNHSTESDTLDFRAVSDDITITYEGDLGISRDLHREVSILGKAAEKIYGGSGNDRLNPLPETSSIDGDAGNDQIHGDSRAQSLSGGAGNDEIFGGGGNDLISGGTGNDTIYGDSGNDWIYGGAGNDLIYGFAGDDVIAGEDGLDTVDGGEGNDEIWGTRPPYFSQEWTYYTEPYANILLGGPGDDELHGSNGPDILSGGAGNDEILGGEGNDRLDGGAGNDQLNGEGGDDVYVFATGVGFERDVIRENELTNSGNSDTLDFSTVADDTTLTFDGELGISHALHREVAIHGSAAEKILGGGGNDLLNSHAHTISISGGAGNDQIIGNSLAQTLLGEVGDDEIFGGAGHDRLDGGAGNDRLNGQDGSDQYIFVTGVGFERDVIQENDLTDLDNADTLYFSAVEDNITLTFEGELGISHDLHRELTIYGSAAESIYGGSGNDLLNSHAHTIAITGNGGNDQIIGNNVFQGLWGLAGDDEIFGGGGNNLLIGGTGNDRLFASGTGINTIDGGAGDDWIQGGDGINNIEGRDGNDTIYGGLGNDSIRAGTGDDLIYGLAGDDVIHGEEGLDTLDGGEGNDELWGNRPPSFSKEWTHYPEPYSNILLGGPGDDKLHGSSSPDHFSGGQGIDSIYGDEGDDTLMDGAHDDGDQLDSIEIFPPGY